jgi:hypothetical protein
MALKYKENSTANYYVYMLESGNDTNDGLTPTTAIKTCERAVAILNAYAGAKRRYVVSDRRKIYNESITTTRTTGKPITWEFLNRCIIDGSGINFVTFTIEGDTFINCSVENYGSGYFLSTNKNADSVRFYNCFFKNNGFRDFLMQGTVQWAGAPVIVFFNCAFYNSHIGSTRTDRANYTNYYNCVFENCLMGSGHPDGSNNYVNCIFKGSFSTHSPVPPDYKLINCCLYGTVYGKTLATIEGEGKATNCIDDDPLFNDSANNVYTVTSSSPCLYAGTNNQHIGIGEAFYLSATTLFTDAVDSDNLELSSGKLIRTDVDLPAYLETKVFRIGANHIISMIDLAATLGYLNEQVIQSVQLDPKDGGDPYSTFLTFKLKVGKTESACNESDWITLPFNQQPLVDESGVGNGSEDIDVTDVWSTIKINYFKIYIFITNL